MEHPNLRFLELYNAGVKDIEFVRKLKNLEDLSICEPRNSDLSLEPLRNLRNLASVAVEARIHVDLSVYSHAPKLRSLSFSGARSLDNFSSIQTAQGLTSLYLGGLDTLLYPSKRQRRM